MMQYFVRWSTPPASEPSPSMLVRRPYPRDFRGDESFLFPDAWMRTDALQQLESGRLDDAFGEITEAEVRDLIAQLSPTVDVERVMSIEPPPLPVEPLADPQARYPTTLVGNAHVFPVSHNGKLVCYVWYSDDDTSAGVQHIVGNKDLAVGHAWRRGMRAAKADGLRPSEAWARLSVKAPAEGRGDVHFDDEFTVGTRAELTALMTDPRPVDIGSR